MTIEQQKYFLSLSSVRVADSHALARFLIVLVRVIELLQIPAKLPCSTRYCIRSCSAITQADFNSRPY